MLKRNFIILSLVLFISSCFSNNNDKEIDQTYNTWNLNKTFSWNIINEEKSFSWTWNILETKVSSWVTDKKVIEISDEIKEKTNKDVTDLKTTKKPIIKPIKKETNTTNEQNVDALEKDLEKELDSLIDLINENE